jgi:hypothetical protein
MLSLHGLGSMSFWPQDGIGAAHLLYITSLIVAAAFASVVVARANGASRPEHAWFAIYLIGYIAASVIRVAPTYIEPQYTIREISDDLGHSLTGVSTIIVHKAEGVFNDNSLHYRRWTEREPSAEAASIVVTAFELPHEPVVLQARYDLVKIYHPYVSPDFFRAHPGRPAPEIKVYKRKVSQ